MRQELQRKVYFFRLAEYTEFHGKLEEAVAAIDMLPFNDQGRYLTTTTDDVLLALFVTTKKYPIKLQFGRIRRSALPMVEDAGEVSPLKISQSAGIIDWSHIVIFDDGTVAAEFNRDAPRLARLGEYMSFKSQGVLPAPPKFYPLFQRAILEELENFQGLTILEVEASALDADLIAEADKSLSNGFKACQRAGDVKAARLVLKAEGRLDNKLRELARRLITSSKAREALSVLQVTGKAAGGRRTLNMLEEYLVSVEDFIRIDQRTRALHPDSAFATLERAYFNKRSLLAVAATANSPW